MQNENPVPKTAPIEAAISRLSALCDVPASYDDEDMSVRQGDLKAVLVELQCLRTENDELQTTVDGLQSIINRAKANGGNIYA